MFKLVTLPGINHFIPLSPVILKNSCDVIAPILCDVINESISTCEFPDIWKVAKIIPIFKSGLRNNANNYRPISVLCTASKIPERHIHNSLYSFLCKYYLISKSQSAFKKCHSCQTCLTNIINKYLSVMDNSEFSVCLALDLKRAFDLIDRRI